MIITKSFTIKYLIKGHPDYGITSKGDVFNLKRGTQIKVSVIGVTVGMSLNGKFRSWNRYIKPRLELVPKKVECPF